jgi:hypothetical protein
VLKIVTEEYLKKRVINKTGLLYTEIVGSALELYLPTTEKEFRVLRDPKTLKGVPIKRFDEVLKNRLMPQLPTKALFEVQPTESTSSPNIQVADWICGALARYYEKKPLGNEFYKIMKSYIVGEKELFADYWTKKWEKEK